MKPNNVIFLIMVLIGLLVAAVAYIGNRYILTQAMIMRQNKRANRQYRERMAAERAAAERDAERGEDAEAESSSSDSDSTDDESDASTVTGGTVVHTPAKPVSSVV